MKTKLFYLIILFPLCFFAQENDSIILKERYERMKSRKIAFISDKVYLTPKQAEAFWPLYNLYTSKKRDVYMRNKKSYKKYQLNKSLMDNDELGLTIDEFLKLDQEELDIKVEYVKKFTEIITNKQLIELYDAEESFKKDLLRRIKKGSDKGILDKKKDIKKKKIESYSIQNNPKTPIN
ncbi:MAG: hypothetical protein CMC04_09160 [Flavobacteriaceae bacterium]|nr:hypothetical protein [Flavobacteriaceae bacterium]